MGIIIQPSSYATINLLQKSTKNQDRHYFSGGSGSTWKLNKNVKNGIMSTMLLIKGFKNKKYISIQ